MSQQPVELGYFAVPTRDPERAGLFWTAVLGWTFTGPDEHGYLDIESTRLPGGIAPMPGETVACWFRVEDIDAAVGCVRELGGTAPEPEAFGFGRVAACTDDQGTEFQLWEMAPGLFPPGRRGNGHTASEPGYFVVSVLDTDAGAAFYGPLFGWEFAPATENGYRHITNIRLPGGLADLGEAGVHPWIRVDDIEAIATDVVVHGGTAGPRETSDSGVSSNCEDDQGVRFSLWQPAPGL